MKQTQSTYETNINNRVDNLEDTISSTQVFHKYQLIISETTTTGAEVTIPCNYKVGQDVLDVYLNGERLILSSDDIGTDGSYLEAGTAGSISNKIKITSDWNLDAGDIFEFVVRGDYSET